MLALILIQKFWKVIEMMKNIVLFFKKEIGEHFKFNVAFMNWMKGNSGKTYREAIDGMACYF